MKSVSGVPSTNLRDIFRLLEGDLQEVERALEESARSALPLMNDINRYLHTSGGKRFRPTLLLLCSKMCGFGGEAARQLSVVVELIHVATLVHDDIIDNAETRRGRPSVNAKWGNQVTVLAGDWLYMTSFALALKLREFRILDLLIEITRKMVEGELIQLERLGQVDISADEQLEICKRKTADLFSCCGRLGAVLGKAGPAGEEKLGAYGHDVGMAFQLIDDLLDYTASEDKVGKPVLKDLEEGKVTLPIILLLKRATLQEQAFVREVIQKRRFTAANKRRIIDLVDAYGTLEDVKKQAAHYVEKAREALMFFPDSIYREALLRFSDFIVDRDH